ncbi:MAG: hypothetical protein ACPG4Z_05220 [Chitinophagales bacterium]
MKTTIKIFSTTILLVVTAIAIAQNPTDDLSHIVDSVAKNCDGPKWGQDSIKALTNQSLYREYYRQKNYKDAAVGWRYVFMNTPKGSTYIPVDGVKIFESFAKEVGKEDAMYENYIDTILSIYEVRSECFGITADLKMRKAFAWYKYRNKGNEEFVYNLFKETVALYEVENKKNEISSAFLTPWILMAIKAHKIANVIDASEVLDVFEQISAIADYNIDIGNNTKGYNNAKDKTFEYLNTNIIIDCNNIVPIATKKYNENPTDTSTVIKVYKMLKEVKCYDAPFFLDATLIVFEKQPSAALAKFISKRYADAEDYDNAIKYALLGVDLEEEADQKALQTLNVADMYRKKGDYSTSRLYAYKAAELKTEWGAPYLLIGKLYVSSASICTDTELESKAVIWTAIDMWNRAKSIDASVATKAQDLINQYWEYLPTRKELFMYTLNSGDSYAVGCWIGTHTTVRSSD